MASSIGEVVSGLIDKLQTQMDTIKPEPNLVGYMGRGALSRYQEGVKDGLNRAIRALEQVDTTE